MHFLMTLREQQVDLAKVETHKYFQRNTREHGTPDNRPIPIPPTSRTPPLPPPTDNRHQEGPKTDAHAFGGQ